MICASSLFGFAVPTSLDDQATKADAVLRIVVVDVADLDYNDEISVFKQLAKCRIVTNYSNSVSKNDYIYIPCNYEYDEDPSPLMKGDDCIVFLELLKVSPIGHPVTWDATHLMQRGSIAAPTKGDDDARVSITVFEERLRKLLTQEK